MTFGIIREHIAASSSALARYLVRRIGFSAMICGTMGSVVLAQTAIDFIDPLDNERVRIEKDAQPQTPAPTQSRQPARTTLDQEADSTNLLARARDEASSGAALAQERATSFWSRMRASLSRASASLGVPVSGILGLLSLLSAGLALLVGWKLFRKRDTKSDRHDQSDVYAHSTKEASRRRKPGETHPTPPIARPRPIDFTETMPEDFDSIFTEEAESKDNHADTSPAPKKVTPRKDDVSTWRKPNLDHLRDSIRADWAASKKRPAANGDSPRPDPTPIAAGSTDPGERSMADVSDGWEEWDAQAGPEDNLWGERETLRDPANDDEDSATLRIRALRESLRVS